MDTTLNEKPSKLAWIKNVNSTTILQTVIGTIIMTVVAVIFSSVLMTRITANDIEHIQKQQEIQAEQINLIKESKVGKEMLMGIKNVIETQNSTEHKAIIEKIDNMSKSQDEYNKVVLELIKRK